MQNISGIWDCLVSPVKPTLLENEFLSLFTKNHLSIMAVGNFSNIYKIRDELHKLSYTFNSGDTSEILLTAYKHFGTDFIHKLEGSFSIALWDFARQQLYLFRDRLGLSSFFYLIKGQRISFATKIDVLLEKHKKEAILDADGLREILGIGPAKTAGTAPFKNIREIKPACYGVFDKTGFKEIEYWRTIPREHKDCEESTASTIKTLLTDSVIKHLQAKNPCTMLSGGLDSTIITAIASKHFKEQYGKKLDTFSFDYMDNDKHFSSSSFQPDIDRPWIERAVSALDTNHSYIECSSEDLINNLFTAVDAKGLPGMGDIDAAMLIFCNEIRQTHDCALSGEGADEIFGGYPWFHRDLTPGVFPWSQCTTVRQTFVKDDLLHSLNLKKYVYDRYQEAVSKAKKSSFNDCKHQELGTLTLDWFGATLTNRLGKMSSFAKLNTVMPFLEHKLVEYLHNVPFPMKTKGDIVKYLLRKAFEADLPHELLYRKKSPFPKTYNPNYERKLREMMQEVLADSSQPIHQIICKNKVRAALNASKLSTVPWFGQLMAGPQQLAYFLQINYWLKKYNILV